ncbi:MAG: hypothetical protein EOO45_23915 [Flavobacterium sp.]|nr:MAG: hypothetical protein EOO45_23915 [Flavobacterium sp.]
MKYLNIAFLLFLSAALLSCDDDDKARRAETIRTQKQNDSILQIISKNWKFDVPPLAPKVEERVGSWKEWKQFSDELAQKPTGSLRAYKQKSKNLVGKADALRNNIPPFFSKPQVYSRIGVIITKIKSLYTYINLDIIPDKKVTSLIEDVTRETTSLQTQLDELVRISEIPKEEGEEQMLRSLDTVRMANPETAPQPEQSPQVIRPTNVPGAPAVPKSKINKSKILN